MPAGSTFSLTIGLGNSPANTSAESAMSREAHLIETGLQVTHIVAQMVILPYRQPTGWAVE
jgi:hypothetical protein